MHIALMFAVWMAGAAPRGMTPGVLQYIHEQANKRGVPVELVTEVMKHESHGDVHARHQNPDGTVDMGLFQINSVTWVWLCRRYNKGVIEWPYDPYANARMAIRYLSDLYTVTGSWRLALIAYNAGVSSLVDAPLTTRWYAKSIIRASDL